MVVNAKQYRAYLLDFEWFRDFSLWAHHVMSFLETLLELLLSTQVHYDFVIRGLQVRGTEGIDQASFWLSCLVRRN